MMTPAEQFQAAVDAFIADYNATKAANVALQSQNDLLTARNAALVTVVDQLYALAHLPLAA